MSGKFAELTVKYVRVFRNEGLFAALGKSFGYLCRIVFVCERYLLLEHRLEAFSVEPKNRQATLKVIRLAEELTAVAEEGYDLSGLDVRRLRMHLGRQGMFCGIFLDGKLAHQSWVSTNANTDLDPVAPHVDYQGCAYIGACETRPEYRGLALYPYALSEICKALKGSGFSRAVLTISPGNRASIAGATKAGFRLQAKGVFTRVLKRTYWRVIPESSATGK